MPQRQTVMNVGSLSDHASCTYPVCCQWQLHAGIAAAVARGVAFVDEYTGGRAECISPPAPLCGSHLLRASRDSATATPGDDAADRQTDDEERPGPEPECL
jgi:hypothetical protein